ncbi:hypothetical protein ANCDUO_20301 [Ancylostoma duodenale]|uniref:Peptidase S1 domain-containing protein n=1 Tax=Ancylostoma duodenale TaxID=51022 RepID=A0A0C2FSI7_9BILA|nr:hypothetical protein ANCDUO_20301 [Ancylostoma duodenale]
MRDPERIVVIVGINKAGPNNGSIFKRFKAVHNVSEITVLNYDCCREKNDLALIELSQNISVDHSTPICMPSENLQLHGVLYASGSGMDPALPKTLTDPDRTSRGQQVVAQKYYGVDELSHEILTKTFSKSPQIGDSGGPLFQVDESEMHTLVGITSHGHPEQIRKSDHGKNVCPIEDTSSEEESPLNSADNKRKNQRKLTTAYI